MSKITLLIGNNPYIDDIIRFSLMTKEGMTVLGDKGGISFSDRIVVTTKDNSTIKDYFFDKPTIIFTTDIDNDIDIEFPIPENIRVYHFLTIHEMCENALKNSVCFEEGTPLCDLHKFLQERDIENLFPSNEDKTLIFPKTSVVPSIDITSAYFKMKGILRGLPFVVDGQVKAPLLFKKTKNIGVYIPTYYRLEKAKTCIKSLFEGAYHSQNRYTFYIGDNNTQDEEMKKWLDSLTIIKNYDVVVYHSEKNIGKSGIINRMSAPNKEDYIFSIDSDMVLPPPLRSETVLPYILSSLDGMIDILDRCRNIGIVSSHQTGECHHWFGRGVDEKIELGYRLGESKTGIGISGGCIVMRREDWDYIGGYDENYDVYTADDAILMEKVEKKLGKRAVISIDYPLFHPFVSEDDESEKGYKKWKMKRFQEDGLKFSQRDEGWRGTSIGYFEEYPKMKR